MLQNFTDNLPEFVKLDFESRFPQHRSEHRTTVLSPHCMPGASILKNPSQQFQEEGILLRDVVL